MKYIDEETELAGVLGEFKRLDISTVAEVDIYLVLRDNLQLNTEEAVLIGLYLDSLDEEELVEAALDRLPLLRYAAAVTLRDCRPVLGRGFSPRG